VAPSIIDSAPILSVTPLYHFSSDAPELLIHPTIVVRRFDEYRTIPFDDDICKHLRVYEPDYLLWHFPLTQESYGDLKSLLTEEKFAECTELLVAPTAEFLRLLRLFKPGRVRAGETFILHRPELNQGDDFANWTTVAGARASAMVVDYQFLASQTTSYVLNSTEIPFLLAFRDNLVPVFRNISSFPTVATALHLYGQDNGEQSDVVGAVTALEALLTKEDEREGLTYRLSVRVANLLGRDADERKRISRDVKSFYDLRSTIVHGSRLRPKLLNRLNELDSLRETLRRVLLSVMALLSQGVARPTDLPDLLDDLAFDDEKRKQVQAIASKSLYIGAEKASS
jgi:Apea-like HEPN